ncbi:MAG: SMR family transporter [Thermoleophilia bacterium]
MATDMDAIQIILVLLTSVSASLGNTLLKVGSSAGGEGELLVIQHLPRTLLKPAILGGAVIYAISQILWITLLRKMDLSQAYPLQIGLNFIFIMLIARLYFNEPVSRGKLLGIALIFAGIIAIATATAS